jgi:hypothetical protein
MASFDLTIEDAIAATEATLHNLEMTKVELLPFVLRYKECCQSLSLAQAQLAELRNCKAPISKLATETLAMIFEAGLDDDFGSDEILHHGLPFSLLVSQVCRAWRRTAINLPFLWSSIRINTSKPRHFPDMYVERSKSCAVDIQLVCNETTLPTFDSSILHLNRCRRLKIGCIFYSSAFEIIKSLRIKEAPRLTSLNVGVWRDDDDLSDYDLDEEDEKGVQILQGGAPKLTTVDLQCISIRSCCPPLNAILHLTLSNNKHTPELHCCEFREALAAAASSITHLVLEGIIVRFTDDDNFSQILLPHLLHLRLDYPYYFHRGDDDDDYVARLATIIVAPRVQGLHLEYFQPQDVHHILRSLLPRNGTNNTLRSLHLQFVVLDSPACDLFQAFINITQIFIACIPQHVDCVLRFMLDFDQRSQPSNNSPLWPHLHTLGIDIFDDKLLRTVVLSRKAAGYPLTKLCLPSYIDSSSWYQEHIDEVVSWNWE